MQYEDIGKGEMGFVTSMYGVCCHTCGVYDTVAALDGDNADDKLHALGWVLWSGEKWRCPECGSVTRVASARP